MQKQPVSPGNNKAPIDKLWRPFNTFFMLQSASGIMLMAATIAALLWANSTEAEDYFSLWNTKVGIVAGEFSLQKTIGHWINDGLMVIFFFVVGLEIKRELLAGELKRPRKAALPLAAALGGMIVPAGIFFALNAGGVAARGWGIPMATDIAFALGVLALLGSRVPISLKIFLTALAIVDDLGAVLIIAIFYSTEISGIGLVLSGAILSLLILINRLGIQRPMIYFACGILLWLAFLESGIHATIAGVLLAMTIPCRSTLNERDFPEYGRGLLQEFNKASYMEETPILNEDRMDALMNLEQAVTEVLPPLQRMERRLHPWIGFGILPLFAFANAGVAIEAGIQNDLASPLGLGILSGLLLGKPIGIVLFSWLAVKVKIASLPDDIGWAHIVGVGLLGGMGFTMSLFISALAFVRPELMAAAKVSILAASLIAGIAGWITLRLCCSPAKTEGKAG